MYLPIRIHPIAKSPRPALGLSRRISRVVASLFVLLGVFASSVSAQKVDITSLDSADFDSYQSFSFQPFRLLATGEPAQKATVEQLLKDAITSELSAKGMQPVDESPDVFIAVHLGLEQNTRRETGGTRAQGRKMSLNEALAPPKSYFYRKGIAVIELVDAKTNTAVWRADCSANIRDSRDREKKILQVVAKAFKKYPPR